MLFVLKHLFVLFLILLGLNVDSYARGSGANVESTQASCVPLLGALVQSKTTEEFLPKDQKSIVDFLLGRMDLFSHPDLAATVVALLGEDKILKSLELKDPNHFEVDPDVAAEIFDNFLPHLYPNNLNEDVAKNLYLQLEKRKNAVGQAPQLGDELSFKDFQDWQRVGAELIIHSQKAQITTQLIQALLPQYIRVVALWLRANQNVESMLSLKNYIRGLIFGIGAAAGGTIMLDWRLGGMLFAVGAGVTAPFTKGVFSYSRSQFKAGRLLKWMSKNGNSLMANHFEDASKKPMSESQFSRMIKTIVNQEALDNLSPSLPERFGESEIISYGVDFDALMVGFGVMIERIQDEREVTSAQSLQSLKQRAEEVESGKGGANYSDLIVQGARLRTEVSQSVKKIETLNTLIELGISKLNEFIRFLEVNRKSTTNQRVAIRMGDRIQELMRILDIFEQHHGILQQQLQSLGSGLSFLTELNSFSARTSVLEAAQPQVTPAFQGANSQGINFKLPNLPLPSSQPPKLPVRRAALEGEQ